MNTHKRFRRSLKLVLALLAAAAATASLLWSREQSFAALSPALPEAAYRLSPGSRTCYAASDRTFAAASTEGWQLFSENGDAVAADTRAMSEPACDISDAVSVFYSAGDTALQLAYPDGSVKTLDTETNIRFAAVNEKGLLAVITDREGYKGSVTVYNQQLQPLFRWDAGADRPVCARLSPRGRLAIGCSTEDGSRLLVFRTDRETPLYQRKAGGEHILDLNFLTEDSVALLTDSGLLIQDLDRGSVGSVKDVGYPAFFESTGNLAVLVSTPERYGGRATVSVLSGGGDLLGTRHISGGILDLSVSKHRILLLSAEELILCTRRLEVLASKPVKPGTEFISLRPDGTALAISPEGAALYDLLNEGDQA